MDQPVERREERGASREALGGRLRVDPPRRRTCLRSRPGCRPRRRPSGGRRRAPAASVRRGSGGPRRPGRPACRPGRPARPGPTGVRGPGAPATATSPRAARNSSIWVTLRSFVQPDDCPRHRRSCRGCRATTSGPDVAQLVEHPPAERVVGGHPFEAPRPPDDRPAGHLGEVQAEVRHRPHHRERRLDHGRLQRDARTACGPARAPACSWAGCVAFAQPAPGDEVRARRDRRRRVQLQERQPVDDARQVTRPVGVEQLRPDGDPASLLATQPADRL